MGQVVREIELWSRDGKRLADITPLCHNVFWHRERNEAEMLQFTLDLDAFEDYLINKAALDPVSNFVEGQTEIKVKENGAYLFGTQLYYAPIYINNDAQSSLTIPVQAVGYLNFFQDRYPDPAISYQQIESVDIARGLITQAQAVPYGDYGITLPGTYYKTGVLRDRSFEPYTSSVKLNIQRLTSLVSGRFDFEFTWDKQFKTYERIGSPRPEVQIVFDRATKRSTIDSARLERGANNLYNQTIGLGSGFGADQLTSIKNDYDSQLAYGLRQEPYQFNDVSVQATLDDSTNTRLQSTKNLLRMPTITMTDADLPTVPLNIGDRVYVDLRGRRLLQDTSGVYQVEVIETKLDDNLFGTHTYYFEKTTDAAYGA